MKNTTLERLISRRKNFLDDLVSFLKFESVSAEGSESDCRPCAQWLTTLLKRIGFDNVCLLEGAAHPCVYAEKLISPDAPTVMIYGHYDVQPADPLDEWKTPPFDPRIIDGYIYARGAGDNKGQVMTWLRGLDAVISGGELAMNVKIFLEGTEEIGSPGVAEVVRANRELLRADGIVSSDMPWYADGTPAMTTMLRGMFTCEVIFHGPSMDVHSGHYGGLVVNPINAMASLIASMHDDAGRVAIPGFYDDVREVPQSQLDDWRKLPYDESARAGDVGLKNFAGGEAGLEPLVREWARPTLECNGIIGGYTGNGSKSIIPARSSVKISVRLVADQNPDKIESLVRDYVMSHVPAGIRCEFETSSNAPAMSFPTDTPLIARAAAAIEKIIGKKPVFIGAGGTIAITAIFTEQITPNIFFINMGLPDDNIHSPNEHFRLDFFDRGTEMVCRFLGSDTLK